MNNKPFSEYIASLFELPYDSLKLKAEDYRALYNELNETPLPYSGFMCQMDIEIKGHPVYVIYGANKSTFYKRGGRYPDKPLYQMDIPQTSIAIPKNETGFVPINIIGDRFTDGQKILLNKLNECLRKGVPFDIDEARIVFVRSMRWRTNFEGLTKYNYETKTWGKKIYRDSLEYLQEHPTAYDNQAKNWLKSNIGALVMKGALIAIPVIELEQLEK